jgi:hypothetical protein
MAATVAAGAPADRAMTDAAEDVTERVIRAQVEQLP